MSHRDVQAIGVVVSDVLPIYLPRPERHTSLRDQLLHAVKRHLRRVRRSHLTHAGQTGLEPHENEPHEYFEIQGRKAVTSHVEARECLPIGHSHEAAIEGIRPSVVRTGDAATTVALRAINQPRSAM